MNVNTILLPFDGSGFSMHAAEYALDMAKLTGAHVHIIYCDDWGLYGSEVSDAVIEEIRENRKLAVKTLLLKADAVFLEQGVKYSLESVSGAPGDVLSERAKSKEYDMIIMGSHGHSNIAGLFLGSVTHKVLNKIYCPILIVP